MREYYVQQENGVYAFIGRDEADYFRIHGYVNEEMETEGFYVSDAEGVLAQPAQLVDLAAELETLAPVEEEETPAPGGEESEDAESTLALAAAEFVPAY